MVSGVNSCMAASLESIVLACPWLWLSMAFLIQIAYRAAGATANPKP
jgi:hypothetical protein